MRGMEFAMTRRLFCSLTVLLSAAGLAWADNTKPGVAAAAMPQVGNSAGTPGTLTLPSVPTLPDAKQPAASAPAATDGTMTNGTVINGNGACGTTPPGRPPEG